MNSTSKCNSIIKTRVYTNETYVIVYRIRCVRGAAWKVYDVVIDGVSLLKQYSRNFRDMLDANAGDVDKLILRMKNLTSHCYQRLYNKSGVI